jgi:hypothetical protein
VFLSCPSPLCQTKTKQTLSFTLPTLTTLPTPSLTSAILHLPLVGIHIQEFSALVLLVARYFLHPTHVFTYAWLLSAVIFVDHVEVQAVLDTQLIFCAFLSQTESFCGALPQKFRFSESQVF